MPDLVAAASAILSQSQQRAEIAAQNVANATMPAYKRRVPFAELLEQRAAADRVAPNVGTAIDFTAGKLAQTGNPYDLAISGAGFFAVRNGETVRYVRAGRFMRDPDGRLVDAAGGALQKSGGGDVVVFGAAFKVGTGGDISENGTAAGKIGVFTGTDAAPFVPVEGGFAAPPAGAVPADAAEIVQGAYEVSTGTRWSR